MSANANPVLVQVTRGETVESFHRGAYAIVNADGETIASAGDITHPVFPRSAIKALQALAMIDSGAAGAYGFSPAEIALACSSHNGEPAHIECVRSMLKKTGIDEKYLECGFHWPTSTAASRQMVKNGITPNNLHNNCSGKHAGMLATAKYLGEPLENYIKANHPVQARIQTIISEFCQCELIDAPCGIDGCSVPTWAVPLKNLAWGFARLTRPDAPHLAQQIGTSGKWSAASAEIFAAARAAPQMIAGTGRYCTKIMQSVPRLFAKTGAEGVYCGAIAHAGVGIAVKCDDGATRAAEVIFANIAANLPLWDR